MSKSDIPCPFCGGDSYPYRFGSIFVAVQCATCKAQGPSVKIPMEDLHKKGKTWGQVFGKASKRALERWARCTGDTNERPEENSNSHGTRSGVLEEKPRSEVPSNDQLSGISNGRKNRIRRFVGLGRRQVPENYGRD